MVHTPMQGDVALLKDPIEQELLRWTGPARLAYNWTDGTPRLVPIGFHWDGREFVLGTPANAPKLKALADTKVALTIDTNDRPYKVLLVRGTATVRMMDGIVPEYVLMAHRCMGDGAETWLKQVEAMLPAWGGILHFVQRFRSAIEHAMSKTLSA